MGSVHAHSCMQLYYNFKQSMLCSRKKGSFSVFFTWLNPHQRVQIWQSSRIPSFTAMCCKVAEALTALF